MSYTPFIAADITGLLPPATAPFGTTTGTVADGGVLTSVQTVALAALPVAGGTMTGTLTLVGNPTAPLAAAPKQYVDAVLTTVTATGATTARSLANHFADSVSVMDFGAVGDGVTDDGPAIQRAHDAMVAAGGGTVHFPAKTFVWNTQVVAQNAAVRFCGTGWHETCASGTRILVSSSTVGPLLVQGTATKGGGVYSMSFQQAQPPVGSGWAPTAYPPIVDILNTNGQWEIDDVFFYNVYDAIRARLAPRLRVGKIRGQPLHAGISIDGSTEAAHVEDVHFSTYWSSDASVVSYMQANADAVLLFSIIGFQAGQIFANTYRSAVHLSYSSTYTAGSPNFAQFGTVIAQNCVSGILVDGTGASASISNLITTNQTASNSIVTNGTGIYLTSTNCTLSVANAKLFFAGNQLVLMDQSGGGNVLTIGNLELNNFNQFSNSSPAFQIANGSTPNQIFIANMPNVVASNGARLINDCNAWFKSHGATPYLATPTTGTTVTLVTSHDQTILTPTSALATLTIVLPTTYIPNGEILVFSTRTVTAVTWQAGATTLYAAPNALTAGQAVRFKFFSTSITAEGYNGWYALDTAPLPISGGTLTGALLLAADPTAALGAVTKQYVDNSVSSGLTPLRVITSGSSYTLQSYDVIVVFNKSPGSPTAVTLMSNPPTGRQVTIKDGAGDASTNNITVTPSAGTIDGASGFNLNTPYGAINFVYNGTQWNAL